MRKMEESVLIDKDEMIEEEEEILEHEKVYVLLVTEFHDWNGCSTSVYGVYRSREDAINNMKEYAYDHRDVTMSQREGKDYSVRVFGDSVVITSNWNGYAMTRLSLVRRDLK